METILKDYIAQKGMISISEFMQICLGHPTHGYYMKKAVFGKDGDFTTAPEISQMFGEIIGLWLMDTVSKMPKAEDYNIIELGPGRGTLMNDVLRVANKLRDHYKLNIHLVEMSDQLVELQREKLKSYDVNITWHKDLESLDAALNDSPCLFVANEFFDALPVAQYEFLDNRWFERMVDVKEGKITPSISMKEATPKLPEILKKRASDGAIFETSPASFFYLHKIIKIIKQRQGVGLFIDYGHDGHGFGDSLQAVKSHKFSSIFENFGEQDLTAHVNFTALKEFTENQNVEVTPIVSQANFLGDLAIGLRAQMLIRKNPNQELEIASALNRLIDEDEMGNLFKVICIYKTQSDDNNIDFTPEGFGVE